MLFQVLGLWSHLKDTEMLFLGLSYTYKLDTETKGSTVFRNPRALGCSDPSAVRALLRA